MGLPRLVPIAGKAGLAEAVLRSATTVEVQVGDDGETDELGGERAGMEYWRGAL